MLFELAPGRSTIDRPVCLGLRPPPGRITIDPLMCANQREPDLGFGHMSPWKPSGRGKKQLPIIVAIVALYCGGRVTNNGLLSPEEEYARLRIGREVSKSVFLAMNVEIYVSNYNTNDIAYWTKPTEAQEGLYRTALGKTVRAAAVTACKDLNLAITQQSGLYNRCQQIMELEPRSQKKPR
jgi:hypothetical protein